MLLLFLAQSGVGQEKASLEQRLTRLEEGQKALKEEVTNLRSEMNARFAELRGDMNARFEEISARFEGINARFGDINGRFDDLKSKFGWLYLLLSAIIALNGAMVGSVVWLARQERPVGQRHYEQILRREDEIEREILSLRQRLENIEKAIQPS